MTLQSGNKSTYETGAQRDSDDTKSRPDLVPGICMLRLGHRYADGAKYYGAHNFEKGIPSSRGLASLQRHLEQWKAGDPLEDHLGGLLFNAFLLMFNEEMAGTGHFKDDKFILDHPRYKGYHEQIRSEEE